MPRSRTAFVQLLTVLAAIFIVSACTSLPPAQPAKDLSAIAGRWQGTVEAANGFRAGITMTIDADGRYVSVFDRPAGNLGTTFPGRITIEDGRYRFRSDRTGSTGTITLHEGEGKRVLALRGDAGITANLTLVRQ